jgi:hypothetical protein
VRSVAVGWLPTTIGTGRRALGVSGVARLAAADRLSSLRSPGVARENPARLVTLMASEG